MEFRAAVKTGFQKYVTFSGRASRSEYWWFLLFCVVGGFVWGAVAGFVQAMLGLEFESPVFRPSSLFGLVVLLPALALQWRRFHDFGWSGWWTVALFAIGPLFGGVAGFVIAVLYGDPRTSPQSADLIATIAPIGGWLAAALAIFLMTRPSQPGSNKYGPNPQEVN